MPRKRRVLGAQRSQFKGRSGAKDEDSEEDLKVVHGSNLLVSSDSDGEGDAPLVRRRRRLRSSRRHRADDSDDCDSGDDHEPGSDDGRGKGAGSSGGAAAREEEEEKEDLSGEELSDDDEDEGEDEDVLLAMASAGAAVPKKRARDAGSGQGRRVGAVSKGRGKAGAAGGGGSGARGTGRGGGAGRGARSRAAPDRDGEPEAGARTKDYFSLMRLQPRPQMSTMTAFAPGLVSDPAKSLPPAHPKLANDRADLARVHHTRFPGWRLQQEEGFNLLLYGFGSKQDLLQDYLVFCCRADPDTAVVVANGAVPTCSIKSIADAITKRIVGTTIRFSSLLEHCRFIAIQMGGGDGLEGVVGSSGGGGGGGGGSGWARRDATSLPRVLLAIHNIDGPALRSPEAQTALSVLASGRRVHVVATVDHVSSPMVFDQRQRMRGNWLWHDATTFQPYLAEAQFLEVDNKSRVELQTSGITHVLASLTPNHVAILKVLADAQLEQMDALVAGGASDDEGAGVGDDPSGHEGGGGGSSSGAGTGAGQPRRVTRGGVRGRGGGAVGRPGAPVSVVGLELTKLFELCLERLLVSTDDALRTVLVELKDHALVKTRRGVDRRELLYLPLSKEQITMISQVDQ